MQLKAIKYFLWGYFAIMVLSACYIYGVVLKANGDNVEHLHTSWMVWMGYIPYKDFFQHHNPLTWYVSAPLVALLIDHYEIFAVFNIIGVLTLCLISFWQYKILLLNNTSPLASIIMAAVMVSSYSLLWSTDYRPDTFMYLFLFIGLYELFLYEKSPKKRTLVISFFCLFISFMFTQKVLLYLAVPGLAFVYWLITGKVKPKDLLCAMVLPIALMLMFALYLYSHDALKIYWMSNYPFNTRIPNIFYENRIIFPPKEYIEFYIFIPLGAVSSLYFLYKGSVIERILSLMFVEETLLRLFYFSAFLHYAIFWLILGIMLSVMFIDKFPKLKKPAVAISLIYLLFMLFYNYEKTYKTEIKSHEFINGHQVAFDVLTPCDYAINGYYSTYNLKAKDAGYYAILLGQIDVLGEKTKIAPKDNLNELISAKKPKLISSGIYWDTYWEQRGKKIPVHKIDESLLNTYYDYSGVGDIYILKPEYQKHYCVYNGKTWEYID